uniref:Uncharacterized protein n=1 Tax=Clytia hemisphaerica TaxID=252671 RepID=A0A7M5XJM3_9CNID
MTGKKITFAEFKNSLLRAFSRNKPHPASPYDPLKMKSFKPASNYVVNNNKAVKMKGKTKKSSSKYDVNSFLESDDESDEENIQPSSDSVVNNNKAVKMKGKTKKSSPKYDVNSFLESLNSSKISPFQASTPKSDKSTSEVVLQSKTITKNDDLREARKEINKLNEMYETMKKRVEELETKTSKKNQIVVSNKAKKRLRTQVNKLLDDGYYWSLDNGK